MDEYIIQGLHSEYGWCLVYTCGRDLDYANRVLDRMLNNPTKDDIISMNGLSEFRIYKVDYKDCWWNQNCD